MEPKEAICKVQLNLEYICFDLFCLYFFQETTFNTFLKILENLESLLARFRMFKCKQNALH